MNHQKPHPDITQGRLHCSYLLRKIRLATLPLIIFIIYLNPVTMQDYNLCFMSFEMNESTFSKTTPQKLVSDKFSKSHSTVLKKNVFKLTLEFKNQV